MAPSGFSPPAVRKATCQQYGSSPLEQSSHGPLGYPVLLGPTWCWDIWRDAHRLANTLQFMGSVNFWLLEGSSGFSIYDVICGDEVAKALGTDASSSAASSAGLLFLQGTLCALA